MNYPKELDIVFKQLHFMGAKTIIVGGFVRDFFLKIDSKDIDVEIYGIESFEKLSQILSRFGKVNSVGKSFGICKLEFANLDLDFSLPRIDSKISKGHKGFEVEIDPTLDYETAFSRRDFTINAVGFNTQTKKFIDPFNGIKDIHNKVLKIVNSERFEDDPLRVLRAIQFSARFNLKADQELIAIAQNIVSRKLLKELPNERIFDEIKKLLLKSKQPSVGFELLEEFRALEVLHLDSLAVTQFKNLLKALDILANLDIKKDKLILMLTLMTYYFDEPIDKEFLYGLTNQKDIIKKVLTLKNALNSYETTEVKLAKLATKIKISNLIKLLKALSKDTQEMQKIATKLDILDKPIKPILEGRDILAHFIKPSKIYSEILEKSYDAQLKNEFFNKEGANEWLKAYLQ